MIEIYGGWYADIYEHGYTVGKLGTRYDSRSGKEQTFIKDPAYFHDLSNAIEYAYKELLREQLGKHRKIISLEEAIKDFRDVERRMELNVAPMNRLAEVYIAELGKKR